MSMSNAVGNAFRLFSALTSRIAHRAFVFQATHQLELLSKEVCVLQCFFFADPLVSHLYYCFLPYGKHHVGSEYPKNIVFTCEHKH